MTTYPNNQNRDWTATKAAGWRASSPDVATMAAYYPPTQARPTGPVAPPQAYGPAYGQAAVPQLAWSAEQPDFNSVPEAYIAKLAWYKRPGVLAFAAAGLVAVAAAGLFGELHSSSGSTPVKPAAQSAPAPAPAPAPMPTPAAQPAAPSYRPSSQSTESSGGYSKPASHQAPPQSPPPSPAPQRQPDQSGQSDPSQWNNSNSYWSNHRDDNSYRRQGDHDNRWNFWNRDHDSDNSRSSSDHDSSNSSNDHSSDSHSNENGNSR